MNLLLAGIFFFFTFLFGLLPFRVLYIISDIISFILHRVVGYRKKVVLKNLNDCFPGMEEAEQKKLLKAIYRNLSDILVESIKSFGMSAKQIKKRYKVLNVELIEKYLEQGRSVMGLPAHFNNWEWGSLAPGLYTNYPIIALYKPLTNKYLDNFIRKSRSKFGTSLSSIYVTGITFRANEKIPSIYVLAADQSPTNSAKSYWVDFLGRDTAFLHGPEKYSRHYNMVVLYADVQRVKRGHYTLELSLISDDPKFLPEGEVTRQYAKKLEEAILKTPGSWLWSHKRWKLSR
ncbi:MAG: lysophospholipid acyltransferase family protein [Bacteroidetes bacterium]|nr:lysophospholipid acyltransferase family protein [Bacteroidota bacterium]